MSKSSRSIDLTYIAPENNKPCELYAQLSNNLNFQNVSSLSLSKFDLKLNNTLPVYLCPIITPYDEALDTSKGFKTPYKITLKTRTQYDEDYNKFVLFDEVKTYELNIYFKNPNYSSINVEYNNIDYNNNNDYFKLYKLKEFTNIINDTITKLWVDNMKLNDSSKMLLPSFDVLNDVLYVYQTYNNDTTIFKNVGKPSKITNKIGEYCFGFNEEFQRDFLRTFSCIKEDDAYYIDNTPLFSNLTNIDLIFVYNSDYYNEGDTPTANPEMQTKEQYYIYEIHDATFYETLSYVSAILITSNNIPAVPAYTNSHINTSSYKLINNSKDVYGTLRTLIKLNVDHSREQLTRLIYSNSSVLTNAIQLENDTSIQSIHLRVYYIDKYMNIRELNLNKYDTLNICFTLNFD